MRYVILCVLAILTSACGGHNNPPTAPAGLYLGYYQENPQDNPEDPTAGAYIVKIPGANQPFSGSLSFTYVGCQTANIGTINGMREDARISGTWSGTLDGQPNGGRFAANYDSSSGGFLGSYDNAGGKQFRDLSPCIRYYIAADGRLDAFPVGTQVPNSFDVTVSGRTVNTTAVNGAHDVLMYVVDAPAVDLGSNLVVWQNYGAFSTQLSIAPNVPLVPGKTYVLAMAVMDAGHERLAFASKSFIAR